MTDRTDAGGPARGNLRQRVLAAEVRFITLAACVITVVGIAVGGHLYGRFLSARDLNGRDAAIEQLQAQAQKLKRSVDDKSAQLTALQIKLNAAQAALEAIMPKANTYNIYPNQSLVIGDGHLTVGLVGAPGNDGVVLNVNGKQQAVPAGQAISVAADSATTCRVEVQSFDVFKAVIEASCAGAKQQ